MQDARIKVILTITSAIRIISALLVYTLSVIFFVYCLYCGKILDRLLNAIELCYCLCGFLLDKISAQSFFLEFMTERNRLNPLIGKSIMLPLHTFNPSQNNSSSVKHKPRNNLYYSMQKLRKMYAEMWKFRRNLEIYRNLAEIRNLVSKFPNFKISSTDFASEGPPGNAPLPQVLRWGKVVSFPDRFLLYWGRERTGLVDLCMWFCVTASSCNLGVILI